MSTISQIIGTNNINIPIVAPATSGLKLVKANLPSPGPKTVKPVQVKNRKCHEVLFLLDTFAIFQTTRISQKNYGGK